MVLTLQVDRCSADRVGEGPMPEMNVDTLNCVYLVLFFIGVGYALFVVVTGGLSSVDMPDVDIDIPQIDLPGDVAFLALTFVSGGMPAGGLDAPDVTSVAAQPDHDRHFITTFGGLGALSFQLLDIDPRWSRSIAGPGPMGLAGVGCILQPVLVDARRHRARSVRRARRLSRRGDGTDWRRDQRGR